jgi:hypothetical protein
MTTVRLFLSQRPIGLVGLDDTGHRVRPAGVLSDASIDTIRRDIASGYVTGWICGYYWYRQATPYCPLDAAIPVGQVAKPCPCEDAVCGLDTLS